MKLELKNGGRIGFKVSQRKLLISGFQNVREVVVFFTGQYLTCPITVGIHPPLRCHMFRSILANILVLSGFIVNLKRTPGADVCGYPYQSCAYTGIRSATDPILACCMPDSRMLYAQISRLTGCYVLRTENQCGVRNIYKR